MGCKNACVCGGMCVGCSSYEPETYCGEAEDLYDELHGKSREQKEYEKAMEDEYYRAMQEQYEKEQQRYFEEQCRNYDFERGGVKY